MADSVTITDAAGIMEYHGWSSDLEGRIYPLSAYMAADGTQVPESSPYSNGQFYWQADADISEGVVTLDDFEDVKPTLTAQDNTGARLGLFLFDVPTGRLVSPVAGLENFSLGDDAAQTWEDIRLADVPGGSGPVTPSDRTIRNLTVTEDADIAGTVTAPEFVGHLTGDVTGDLHGNVDGATGDFTGIVTSGGFVGPGGGITGILGSGTGGGTSSTGSLSHIVDSDNTNAGEIQSTLFGTGGGQTESSRISRILSTLFVPLLAASYALTSLPAAVTGALARLSDAAKGFVYKTASGAWSLLRRDINALDFGVLSDGTAQSTANLQAALTAAGASVLSRTVTLPPGQYEFTSGDFTVPVGVTLQGAQDGPQGHTWLHDGAGQPDATATKGVTFRVRTGAGGTSGYFARVLGNGKIRGIIFYYPDQDRSDVTPTEYPPTILLGESSSQTHFDQTVEDCEFLGAWTAVKMRYGGRFRLANLRGYCVNAFDVDKSYDASWVDDCIFNAFFYSSQVTSAPDDNFYKYVNQNGVGLRVGRVDQLQVTNTYVLGYKYGLETWESSAEGALPGGTAWMDVWGGGWENCLAAARIGQSQAGHGVTLHGVRTVQAHDASGGGGGQGIVVGPDHTGLLRILGGHFGMGGGVVSENSNLLILGGGQIQVGGEAYFFNAVANNILIESPSDNPCNLQIHGATFNVSGSYAIDDGGTGYVSGSATGCTFIQKNAGSAVRHSGLGGYTFGVVNRYLDVPLAAGVPSRLTRWYPNGAVQFPANVEFTNSVNTGGGVEIQSIGGDTHQSWGTVAVNAIYDPVAGEWNRVNTALDAWLRIVRVDDSGSGFFAVQHAAAGANPIGAWTTLFKLLPGGGIIAPLPTSDPHVVGAWWSDSGAVKVSAG